MIRVNIRNKRQELGYTQEKLAEVADCSWRYIQAIEQGSRTPSLTWLSRLATKLNIPLIDFFKA